MATRTSKQIMVVKRVSITIFLAEHHEFWMKSRFVVDINVEFTLVYPLLVEC